jgi:hypothetical protein
LASATAIRSGPAALGETRGVLWDAFGVPFDLWESSDTGWQLISDESSSADASCSSQLAALPAQDVASLLDRVDAGRPGCRVVGGEVLLAVPVSSRVVATAWLPRTSRRWLLRMARLVQRRFRELQELAALRRDQHTCLVQVTSDLESLRFLSGAIGLLEIAEQSLRLEEMAEKLLPTLRPVLRSEALVMVRAASTDSSALAEAERGIPAAVACFEGADRVSRATCLQLVERFRDACMHQTFVVNWLTRYELDERFPHVRELVLAPILRRDATIGWLLALNRAPPDHISPLHDCRPLSELEFGAHEANLLSSAASILGTHASNLELLRQRDTFYLSVAQTLVSALDARDGHETNRTGRSYPPAMTLKQVSNGQEISVRSHLCEAPEGPVPGK